MLLGYLFPVLAHRSGGDRYRRWYGGEFYQAFQVLDGGGEQELVARACQAAQSEPREPQVALYIAEQGLDFLPLASA